MQEGGRVPTTRKDRILLVRKREKKRQGMGRKNARHSEGPRLFPQEEKGGEDEGPSSAFPRLERFYLCTGKERVIGMAVSGRPRLISWERRGEGREGKKKKLLLLPLPRESSPNFLGGGETKSPLGKRHYLQENTFPSSSKRGNKADYTSCLSTKGDPPSPSPKGERGDDRNLAKKNPSQLASSSVKTGGSHNALGVGKGKRASNVGREGIMV